MTSKYLSEKRAGAGVVPAASAEPQPSTFNEIEATIAARVSQLKSDWAASRSTPAEVANMARAATRQLRSELHPPEVFGAAFGYTDIEPPRWQDRDDDNAIPAAAENGSGVPSSSP